MNAQDIEAEFAPKGIPYSGHLLLLTEPDAIALIRRARAAQVRILGIDGMFVTPSSTMSPLEHTANFSASKGGNWAEAETFILSRKGLGLVFEVVLGESIATAV